MKFERFYLESTMQPYEVEEDEWVMKPSPERFGVRILDIGNGLDSKDDMRKIKDWCNKNNVWNVSNRLYFDTEEEQSRFLFIWM
jgi:hypothetical protein